MITKAIRGAITVDANSAVEVKKSVIELLSELTVRNSLTKENISHVLFSVTKDLTKAFPAKFARVDFGWDNVPMMCFNEADIENSLKMCIRVMIVVNCEETFEPQFVYLRGASSLRS